MARRTGRAQTSGHHSKTDGGAGILPAVESDFGEFSRVASGDILGPRADSSLVGGMSTSRTPRLEADKNVWPTRHRNVCPTTILAVVVWAAAVFLGCERQAPAPTHSAKSPTVASLVPAATEMILSMGAGDHLVAVSDFDQGPEVAALPRVGGYNSTDWEKLSQIRPNVIVSFYGASTPPGFVEHCNELGIRQVNVKLHRLVDIYDAIIELGKACDEQTKATAEVARLRDRVDRVRHRVEGLAPVSALVVTKAAPVALAGRDTFLDDLLREAGGTNAITSDGYIKLDREAIATLSPQVVLLLLPDASAGEVAGAKAFWDAFPTMSAVKDHRVWAFTQSYIQHSGPHVADVAEKFAAALHPEAVPASNPSTTGPVP